MTLHRLFLTPHRVALLRDLTDSRQFPATLSAFDAILSDLNLGLSRSSHVKETDTTYVATIELPGFKRDQVHVEVEDEGYVTVLATHSDEDRSVSRVITLPTDADPTKVEAKLEDGILTVTVAKVAKPTPPAPRKVTVS